MSASAIKDFRNDWYLKILSNLHKPLGECTVKEFTNITSCVNPELLEPSYDYSFIIWLRKSQKFTR